MQIDVVLIATTCRELLDAFCSLEGAAERIGLKINENRTKYTAMNTRRLMDILVLEIEPNTLNMYVLIPIWKQYLLSIII
jgi:hypothetical protein